MSTNILKSFYCFSSNLPFCCNRLLKIMWYNPPLMAFSTWNSSAQILFQVPDEQGYLNFFQTTIIFVPIQLGRLVQALILIISGCRNKKKRLHDQQMRTPLYRVKILPLIVSPHSSYNYMYR